ncbi:GreA/GreB family elongation factor [Bradyrhizobium sp. AZCC 1610]|uniref:GreA/GreB family elongation factor n=1 Tax=Bradyrhizobium sp. AZCC 1610 TaxID=3117020 RepID=UPI002FF35A72
MIEINRAEIVPDDALEIESIARIGSWVNYWTRRRMFRKTVQLVWPEGPHVRPRPYLGSVPIGRGTDRPPCRDQMAILCRRCHERRTIESVKQSKPNVDPLDPLLRAPVLVNDDGDDPGTTTASEGGSAVKSRCEGKPRPTLPSIVINARLFPRAARFLAREIDRASVVPDSNELRNVVRMGSEVTYHDEETGEVRNVRLVYPHEADISHGRISVLAPVGTALVGLSVGQAVEFGRRAMKRETLPF